MDRAVRLCTQSGSFCWHQKPRQGQAQVPFHWKWRLSFGDAGRKKLLLRLCRKYYGLDWEKNNIGTKESVLTCWRVWQKEPEMVMRQLQLRGTWLTSGPDDWCALKLAGAHSSPVGRAPRSEFHFLNWTSALKLCLVLVAHLPISWDTWQL